MPAETFCYWPAMSCVLSFAVLCWRPPGAGGLVHAAASLSRGAETVTVNITVSPLENGKRQGLRLITFEDIPSLFAMQARDSGSTALWNQPLERKLPRAEQSLRDTRREHAVFLEEMQTLNEGMTSINDELQASNRELEDAKAQLQSVNEEIDRANKELAGKVQTLEKLTDDLSNLLSSSDIATVFLDRGFRIQRLSPAARRVMRLRKGGEGRLWSEVAVPLRDEFLLADAERVLEDLQPIAKEISDEEGRWYLRRALPYRTNDQRIQGVVITFDDVTSLKRAEQAALDRENDLQRLYATAPTRTVPAGCKAALRAGQ